MNHPDYLPKFIQIGNRLFDIRRIESIKLDAEDNLISVWLSNCPDEWEISFEDDEAFQSAVRELTRKIGGLVAF